MVNLAKGKFQENPPQGGSLADNAPSLGNIPTRAGTLGLGTWSISEN